jgi:hypothetical protein
MSTKKDQIRTYLKKVRCASGKELASTFSISLRQLRAYLRALGCLTSYSHIRTFYTLPGTPRFSTDRIWKCKRRGALFTDLGSLSALVAWHVRESPAGLTCRDLSHITEVRVVDVILRISRERELVRMKFDGEYVYFWRANEKRYRAQVAKRRRLSATGGPGVGRLVDSEVEDLRRDLRIALAFLNHPHKSGRAIAQLLRGDGLHVSVDDLARFLIRYGVKKKR